MFLPVVLLQIRHRNFSDASFHIAGTDWHYFWHIYCRSTSVRVTYEQQWSFEMKLIWKFLNTEISFFEDREQRRVRTWWSQSSRVLTFFEQYLYKVTSDNYSAPSKKIVAQQKWKWSPYIVPWKQIKTTNKLLQIVIQNNYQTFYPIEELWLISRKENIYPSDRKI